MKFRRHLLVGLLAALTPAAPGAYDWTNGPWGVLVNYGGAPGSPVCHAELPGGARTGKIDVEWIESHPVGGDGCMQHAA